MPRPISWLPHLNQIIKTVRNSKRANYERLDDYDQLLKELDGLQQTKASA